RLSRAQVRPEERFDWQPAVLVQVLGEHRGRHWSGVGAVAFSADGKVVYSAGNRQLIAWDAETLRHLRTEGPGNYVRALGTVCEGNALFVTDYGDGVAFHSLPDLKQSSRPPICMPRVVSPDGRFGLDGFGGKPVVLIEFLGDGKRGRLTKK